ncbi:MAG TPA: OsmC family protein [Planctomycetota bacterium]|nr:OsmC family protein [Planctomycetota bacterium]
MKRTSSAQWNGDLKTGKGALSSASGVLANTPYSFAARFESGAGTNPEELLAAAHAGCFTMALAAELGKASLTPKTLKTTATISLDKGETGWSVTSSHLAVTASVPGASPDAFRKAAKAAETGCPVSRLFNTKITLDAKLEG